MNRVTKMFLLIFSLGLLMGTQAQIPGGTPQLGVVVNSFEVLDNTIFENETFTVALSLYNNGSVTINNLRVIVSSQAFSLRSEDTKSTELGAVDIDEIAVGETLNLTMELESSAGSKILSVSFIFNNQEIPTSATTSVSILASPVGDNQTLLRSIGGIFLVIFLLISLQWVWDLIRRTSSNY